MANHPPRRAHAPACFTAAVVRGAAIATTLGALALASCEKKDDAGKPSGIPAMANAASAPAPLPTPPPALQPPPPPAAAETPEAPEAPVDPKAAISGTIVLASSRKGDVAAGDTIFLVARRLSDNPSARGTLVAVKRLTAASFPMPCTLRARDMMIPTGAFDGVVSVSVRVDKDGDPMTHRKGDVIGGLPKVSVGARGVKLALDQLQKEDESLAGNAPMMGGKVDGKMDRTMGGGAMMNPHGELPPGHPPM
jgi:hypothetical protein